MRLGNSGGKNKGKKYFVRGRDDINVKVLYTKEAEDFARWFEKNYHILRRDVRGRSPVNDDAFNETYLRIHELILYTGREIRNYKAFFHRAYFTNYIQLATYENRYCNFLEHVDVEGSTKQLSHTAGQKTSLVEDNENYFEELEQNMKGLKKDIMGYVYDKYQLSEFEIFKMYMELKPAINYHRLAELTGMKYHNIQRTVSTIIFDVKAHKEFHRRRRELV